MRGRVQESFEAATNLTSTDISEKGSLMKKLWVLAVLAAVLLTPLAASAGKKAKPVATKLFFHGDTVIGENDSIAVVNDVFLPMDATEPTGAEPKSKQIVNGIVTPNTQCAGNNLFPVWSGALAGTVKGDVKVTFSAVGTPGPVSVRIWPDVGSLLCTSATSGSTDYPEPAGEVVVDLPAGEGTVEAVMEDVNFKAIGSLMVQISPVVAADLPDPAGSVLTPFIARVLYDTPDFASAIEFNCTPKSGTSCTP